MSVHQYKDGTWYVKFWVPEQHKHRSKTFGKGESNSTAHNHALAFNEEIKALKKLGQSVLKLHTPTTVLLSDIAQDFFDDLKASNKLKQYHRDFANTLNNVVLPIWGEIPVELITAQHLRELTNAFNERGNSNATINRYMGYLKQIFNHGIHVEMIEKNPMRFWRKAKENKKQIKLNRSDLRKIYANSPAHLQWAIVVATHLFTRVGPSELFAIRWKDVDWEHQEIEYLMPKVGKHKSMPCSNEFMELLQERYEKAQSEYLVEYKGKPIKSIKTAWATAVKKSNLDYKPRPYDLRHFAISDLLDQEVPVAIVSALAGHSSTEMTLGTYYHAGKDVLRNTVNKIQNITA